MPYGHEDYQHLSHIFVQHRAMSTYVGLASILGVGFVSISQWGTSVQLATLKTELKKEIKEELKKEMTELKKHITAVLATSKTN